jgi:hypothetical protein
MFTMPGFGGGVLLWRFSGMRMILVIVRLMVTVSIVTM